MTRSNVDINSFKGVIKHSDSGPVCKNIIACCPEGTKEVSSTSAYYDYASV
jgi:hypothetical protein